MSLTEGKNIEAMLIIEVVGRPAEHLTKTLNEIAEKIDSEQGVKVTGKKINEPKLLEKKELYTSFAEIEIEVEEIVNLVFLMYKYMPSHVEVISPELIALTNNGWSEILSGLISKLHKYDEVAAMMQLEKGILEKKLKDMKEKV